MPGQSNLAAALAARDALSRTRRGLTLLLLTLAATLTAIAQDDLAALGIDAADVDEIIVTGTRIKRRDYSSISPLSTIDRAAMEKHGQPTIDELLANMPQAYAGSNRTANHVDGTARVDLRGWGSDRVLMLMNGRRVAPTGTGNAVDLNNIPMYLVDSVEIITGGTSAVYGSDAIAGVMNFITRNDLDGLQLDASYGVTEKGDADTADLNLSYGHNFADDRGNVTVYAGYIDRAPLNSSERAFTSVPRQEDLETGELSAALTASTPSGGIFWPQAQLATGPAFIIFNDDGTPRPLMIPDDLVNDLRDSYIQVPLERVTTGLLAEYRLSDRFESYVEASYANNRVERRDSPVGFGGWVEVNLDNPVLTDETRQLLTDNYACDINLACFDMGRAMSELGRRYYRHDRNYARVVAGFKGSLTDVWDIDGWVTWTRESSAEHYVNGVSGSRGMQGLLVDPMTGECYDPGNGCVPLDMFGAYRLSPAGVDFIRLPPQEMATERTHKLASVYVNGAPLQTWAGPLDIAVGAEWRTDTISYDADEALRNGDAQSFERQARVAGTDHVYELYAEALIPLLSDRTLAELLNIELGLRYSDYKYSGGLWTYKVGADWRLTDSLRFRVMRQLSMRAPNTADLFTEHAAQRHFGSNDRCIASRDPVGAGIVDNCIASGLAPDQVGVWEGDPWYPVNVVYGGNPGLVPERARTWTAGIVVAPASTPRLMASVDFYELEVVDTIGTTHIVNACLEPGTTELYLCDRITRDETGNIAAVDASLLNRGSGRQNGIDTQVALGLGDLSVHLYWTHALNFGDCVGYHGPPCWFTMPQNRVTTSFDYAINNARIGLNWRYIQGTKNGAWMAAWEWGIPYPIPAIPEVGSKHYFDAGLSYDFSERVSARLNVTNLLDTRPPLMFRNWLGINTDTALYDIFGRSYYLSVSMRSGD